MSEKKHSKGLVAKLARLNASDYAISAGFACGAAISMTPFIGFHSILAILTAFILRANIAATLLGTLVGNPWTFALIWPATYETGRFILGTKARANLDFEAVFDNIKTAFGSRDMSLVGEDIKEVVIPMAVGSVFFYIITFILSYVFVKRLLQRIRLRKSVQSS
ncbi:MAG: DUF2062 domain-containing protein [Alphaproteobacteria bacterium]|nr:DUF2062 domain-containing protein [Alphaproteobacteria bacterium]